MKSRIFDFAIYPLVTLATAISFILSPVTNDLRVFLGVAYIADRFYPFPAGLDLAWEIKPLGNRILSWGLLKTAELFAPLDNPFLFGIAVKTIMVAVLAGVCWYAAKQFRIKYGFLLMFLSFALCWNFIIGQCEWWAVLFAVLAIALLLTDSEPMWAASGFLMFAMVALKGITGTLIPVIFISAYLLDKHQGKYFVDKLWLSFIGVVGTACVWVLISLAYWKNQIADTALSVQVSGAGMATIPDRLLQAPHYGFSALMFIPVITFGALSAFIWCAKRDWTDRGLVILMWVFPYISVLVLGEYYIYQYFVFVLPAIVCTLLMERDYETN